MSQTRLGGWATSRRRRFLTKFSKLQKNRAVFDWEQGNFWGIETSRPRPWTWPSRPRTSKCVLEAKDVLKDSTSGYRYAISPQVMQFPTWQITPLYPTNCHNSFITLNLWAYWVLSERSLSQISGCAKFSPNISSFSSPIITTLMSLY